MSHNKNQGQKRESTTKSQSADKGSGPENSELAQQLEKHFEKSLSHDLDKILKNRLEAKDFS